MELTGRVIQLLPLQSGQGKNGQWRKQEFIIETQSQYPKKVCITAWGDKIDQFALSVGQEITVGIELESREFNGKWYTDVRAWKVTKGQAAQQSAPQKSESSEGFMESFEEEDSGQLPF